MQVENSELALFIDGRWTQGGARNTREVFDPADGSVIGHLPVATDEDLDLALDSAERGFRKWRESSADEKGAVLFAAARLLRERSERIAKIATREQGKPLAEARGEVAYTAALVEFYAAEARRLYGRVLVRPRGTRSLVLREPVGPSLALCPWNFPILNPARKIAPALAAGCSVIVKPAEETPGSAIEVVRCFLDAGLPATVLSLVFGDPDHISRRLIASPVIRKVSFTGSVAIGKHLAKLAADGLKRTTMELGGHSPVLVFDDCDVDATVALLAAQKFRNAGQVCVSPTRFYVQEAIYEEFARKFADHANSLRVDSGFADGVQMGPLANRRRPDALEAMIEDAVSSGARLAAGGERAAEGGFFFSPTLLLDVPTSTRAMNEEPFGPLALMQPFQSLAEAIEQANRLPFGLAAYCFTSDLRRATELSSAIEAGMIGINGMAMSAVDAPFGGVKDSGYGSEDGPEGLEAFTVTKAVHQF
ncbi:MAG TPA: NAD-dependent succinate-semialdehyde dehydrogenase [Lautropia sp.]|jgi:succinate-semialdehyde dehydrogenase/glutarate-semialdehyde dehydrogenase|nr:NAD-dependent succinate-semialdehyde dehydrogenase [Lautropia sp.]